MKKIQRQSLAALALASLVAAAPPLAAETLVVAGGTVHPVSGPAYVGNVVVEDGVIVAAGPEASAPADATVLDAAGKHVYPGMMDALSSLGLVEINAVAATDDEAEMGTYNPHLKAATAIHPASEVLPVTRANGITHALVAPAADDDGVIAGQAALIQLDGWTIEEMAIDDSAAMVVSWPEIETRSFDFSTFSFKESPFAEAKEKAEKAQNELRDWLEAARHYRQATVAGSERLEADPRLAALAECLDGGKLVIVRADSQRDIEAAVEFAEEEGLRIVIAGGREAWKVKELLVDKNVPVILGFPMSSPAEDDDPYDRPMSTAATLVEAGVRIALASGAGGGFGPGGPHDSRTLPFEAGAAAAYGLPSEEALRAITLGPAEILGYGDKLGSIEEGKIGNLVVTDGDLLAIATQIHNVVIAGREVSTENRHRSLYQKYRAR